MNSSLITEFLHETLLQSGQELEVRFCQKKEIQTKKDRSLVTDADLASEKIILDRIQKYFPEHHFYSEESGLSTQKDRKEGDYFWIIDPLDGTSNFANNYPFFCVSIALAKVDKNQKMDVEYAGIYDPIKKKSYLANKGGGARCNSEKINIRKDRALKDAFLVTGFYYKQGKELSREIRRFENIADICQSIRRDGAAALDLALVAEGVFDAFWELGLQPWDLAAGILLVKEAGGEVCNYNASNSSHYDLEGEGVIAGSRSQVREILDKLDLH